MMYCETCERQVQPCGWCKGAGMLPQTGKCPGCLGTGKFCRHPAKLDAELQAKLEAVSRRRRS